MDNNVFSPHANDELDSKKKFVSIFHNPVTAVVILIISLVLTATAYFLSSSFLAERAHERFIFRASEIENAIVDRLNIYEQALWGAVGLMNASDTTVTRKGFAKYVETLNVDKNWPGIQGVGYSIPVTPAEKNAHVRSIQAEGFPEYSIRPAGERDLYSSIVFLEPFDWRNKRAFGFDMWSNEMRRNAMTRARDEGVAATSGIITLVQETNDDVQRGFLTYLPVYKSKSIPDSLAERQRQFMGWVYAPFRAGNLMQGIIGSEDANINFKIYDGDVVRDEDLLFDSSMDSGGGKHEPDFTKITTINLQGRIWTLSFSTPADYLSIAEQNQPLYVLLAGTLVDLLIFYVLYSLYFINKRVERLAQERTKELENVKMGLEVKIQASTEALLESKTALEKKVRDRTTELQAKFEELEAFNKTTMGREERVVELKREVNSMANKHGEPPTYSDV